MSTNQERGKISAKAPGEGEPGRVSTEAQGQSPTAGEPSQEMIAVANSLDETIEVAAESPSHLDTQVRMHLGRLVRASYAALVDEPVPERFLDLLEELERAETRN